MAEDLSWADIPRANYWDRLRWARRRWQEPLGGGSAREAAASLGLGENTYTAYERTPKSSKHTPLTHQRAIEFARKFKVRWEWLLTGEGVPELTGARERISQAVDEAASADPAELERKADAIVTLLRTARK